MDNYRALLAKQIEGIIASHRDKVAYSLGDREVTYAELDEMANHIASGVARRVLDSAAPDDVPVRIGISLGRGDHFVPCILAAVKLGCSYVPIDVVTPQERIDFQPGRSHYGRQPAGVLGKPPHGNASATFQGSIRGLYDLHFGYYRTAQGRLAVLPDTLQLYAHGVPPGQFQYQ